MSFFRYPGGKAKLRTEITQCLSEQARLSGLQYREPFFGGGSIGLKLLEDNPNINNVWINDKDIGIACLWTSLIRFPDKFKEHVLAFKPSIEAFYAFKKELLSLRKMPKNNTMLDIGFKKLAIHQISYSGLGTKSGGPLGGEEQKSKYKIDCRWSPQYICQKIDGLHERFSKILFYYEGCTNFDFSELILGKEPKALIYLDPPYYNKGNDLYQYGFSTKDHQMLAILLKNCKHSWVLSYDDCPEIRKLYDWASFKQVNVNYSITATKDSETGERLSRTKPELLIFPRRG